VAGPQINAQVVELVDTQDLKSCGLNSRIGSTPIPGTIYSKPSAFIGGKNMETLSFAFGVLAVMAVMLVAVVVVGIVKVLKMQKEINSLERWISNTEDSVNRRIDQQLDHISNVINNDRKELNLRIDELNRYTDSRFDKMENKFTNGNNAKKQIIND
jgi:hypothetical protein